MSRSRRYNEDDDEDEQTSRFEQRQNARRIKTAAREAKPEKDERQWPSRS